jgi:phospholipid/cholesterol/gamma-HCH transport system ATP-binding protein
MDVPLIEFKDVTKRFGPRTILERVNLQIYEGQVTTLIGLSGSGKSVLLKHIVGLLKPDEGTILFRGKPLEKEGNRCLFRPDELHVSRQRPLRLDDGL